MNTVANLGLGKHLLVADDEDNVLNALARLLRRDGYTLHIARSVREAFEILAIHPVEVVLSDQRMPEKNGTDFLSEVKQRYPHTVRLMLSGYTEVGAVTSAINEGAIYKFLTKPWDDEQLRANVREAFQRYEMEAQNLRLHRQIEEVNAELLQLNHTLEQELMAKNERIRRGSSVACVMQEMIDHLPIGLLGMDQGGELVCVNAHAARLLACKQGALIGNTVDALPAALQDLLNDYLMLDEPLAVDAHVELCGLHLRISIKPMGLSSGSSGCLVLLLPPGLEA